MDLDPEVGSRIDDIYIVTQSLPEDLLVYYVAVLWYNSASLIQGGSNKCKIYSDGAQRRLISDPRLLFIFGLTV